MKKLILVLLLLLLLITSNVYAGPLLNPPTRVETRDSIRQEWVDYLGVDIWAPYFWIRDIEFTIRKKSIIHIGKIEGSLRVDSSKKQAQLIFTYEF